MNSFPETEHKILKFWEKHKIFQKLIKKNKGSKKTFSFLDGPITANNPMGVHHGWGRTYKDLFQRYKAMSGHDERFQNGFDCQGLWVEVGVEKELGFKNKKDIENYGIARFIKKCKERVEKYSKIQTKQSIRLGQWMDWDNSYFTMSDENNYAIWHFLKTCHKKGLLYKGRDVVPWCPRCGTAISQHEIVTEGYKELTHKAVYVKLPLLDKKNTYVLIWTTTPWTLAANVAIAVHPELNYVEAKKGREILIVAKDRLEILGAGYKKSRKIKGKDLAGLSYTGPFDELEANQDLKGKHKIICWKEVSNEEGTGLVHIAPGCGAEDFILSKEHNLEIVAPIEEDGTYKKGFGWLTEKFTGRVAEEIFADLRKKGMLFKIENYTHRYPVCWRCDEELVFRLVKEWYIKMDPIREKLKKTAKKITWIPGFGLARELDWLKNMSDWLISKKRYWGLALPIFECSCGHFEIIGSRQELKKRAVSGWQQFEGKSPHRPQVDKIKIKCSKCGQLVSRIPDVGNCWLDAGIIGFSTMNYFKNKRYWKKWFPADLICESFPGQFRNWFYSLIAMSGILENLPPAKNIFGFGTVVDEKGEEMHKSKGNAIEFNEGAEKIGADIIRWLYVKQNPAANLKFGYSVADEARKKVLILWNSFIYFKTYAQDGLVSSSKQAELKNLTLLDRWILSRLNSLIVSVRKSLDNYNAMIASQNIENFFINDLSTWYIRRSRNRFQKSESTKERQAASLVLYNVLLGLTKLIAPFTPFMAENIYQSLRRKEMPESVHLCDYPKIEKKWIKPDLERKMSQLRDVASLALAKRGKKEIKIRQPLKRLTINKSQLIQDKELIELLKDEVNVKEVVLGERLHLDTKITESLKAEGVIRDLVRSIQGMRKHGGLKPGQLVHMRYQADAYLENLIQKQSLEIKNQISAKQMESAGGKKEAFLVEKEFELNAHKIWIGIKKA